MAAVTNLWFWSPRRKKSCHYLHSFPSTCHEVMGPDAISLVFLCWVLSQLFHSPPLPSSKGSSVPLSAIRVVSSAYLRLLIFLPAILILACNSSSPIFCMMYLAYKLNKQSDNIQSCHTPFLILNQSVVPCKVLTVASWPAYRFLRSQVKIIWYSYSLKTFHFAVNHTVKGFHVVNEAEVNVLGEFPCFLYDPTNVGNLISGSSAFSKPSLYIWKFSIQELLKPSLKDVEHNLTSMGLSWELSW